MKGRALALSAAAFVIGVGVLVLMIYSIDRTSWGFQLYETGRDGSAWMGWWAAVVSEVAVVVLIVADGIADLAPGAKAVATQIRRWAWWSFLALFANQIATNLLAGYLRGFAELDRQLVAAGVTGDLLWMNARTLIGVTQWLLTNGLIPFVLLGLSKIEATVLQLLVAELSNGALQTVLVRESTGRRWTWPTLRMPAWLRARPKPTASQQAPALPAQPAQPQPAPVVPQPSSDAHAPRKVPVSASKLAEYQLLLAGLDEHPQLETKWITQVLGVGERAAQLKRKELIEIGVIKPVDVGYVRNGVELVEEGV